jgi:hypothetical protein
VIDGEARTDILDASERAQQQRRSDEQGEGERDLCHGVELALAGAGAAAFPFQRRVKAGTPGGECLGQAEENRAGDSSRAEQQGHAPIDGETEALVHLHRHGGQRDLQGAAGPVSGDQAEEDAAG